ncbi:MAG: hypothetical protein RR199_03795 [Alistipes sp.]
MRPLRKYWFSAARRIATSNAALPTNTERATRSAVAILIGQWHVATVTPRVLIWAAAGDLRHIALMEHCRGANVDTPTHIDCYQVCPLCGSIYTADYTDTYCPICLTDGRIFIGCQ